MRLTALLLTAGGFLTLAAASSSAMPIGHLGNAASSASDVQDVRLVCNRWGRCWRTGPRRYYGPRYYAPPAYGYYPYGGYYRPYGYGGYGYGRPGIGFSFRF
jgi:hypothetical protein